MSFYNPIWNYFWFPVGTMTADAWKSEVGQRLAEARKGQTQAVFAARLGIDTKTLGFYERGIRPPPLETLIRVQQLTGISLDWIATGTEQAGGPIDVDIIRQVIQVVEEETPEIDATSKARLISRLYNDRIKAHSIGIEADAGRRGKLASS